MSAVQQLLTEHLAIWTDADTAKRSGRGRSSGNAASVYGVKKLRELIYELAATGCLVNQENEIKVQELLLGEVSDLVMGQAPPGSECNTNGKGTIFVKTGEFGILYPEVKEWTTKPLKFAKKGDVLICVVGATIGKLNLGIDCAIGRSVAAIRPNNKILTEFLYLVLVPFTIRLRESSRGSAQPVIGKTELSAVKIRVPSLDVQHRIVAKVDELMALCDQLETQHNNAAEAQEKIVSVLLDRLTQSADAEQFAENWQRIASHFDTLFTTEASIDALKQTLLQLAVMGKLVPQDVNDEPASKLLQRIQAEKANLAAAGKIKKDKPLPEITDEEKPFALPVGWGFSRLGSLVNLKGGFAYQSSKFIESGKHQVIRMGNIRPDFLRVNEKPVFIKSDYGLSTNEYKLETGDILLTMTGTKNKRDYLYSVLIKQEHLQDRVLYLNQRLCAVRALIINIDFLNLSLKNDILLDAVFAKSTGTANQANIGMEAITNWVIPLPPLAEQHRIVAKVDELMAICDQLKTRITAANQLQQKLADVVVENALL